MTPKLTRSLIAMLVLLISLLICATASAKLAGNKCFDYADRYRLEDQNSVGLVFSKPLGNSGQSWYYRCWFARQKARRLPGQDLLGPPTKLIERGRITPLVGRRVAYVVEVERSAPEVHVVNIKTGAEVIAIKDAGPGGIAGIALSPTGSVAWVTFERMETGVLNDLEVRRAFPGSSDSRTLDSGSKIDPNSLAFGSDGVTLFWLNAGQARSDP